MIPRQDVSFSSFLGGIIQGGGGQEELQAL